MSLDIDQIDEQLKAHSLKPVKVDESVIRFTREFSDRPFAVYYIDVRQELPGTSELLNTYQDRVIGKRFFKDSKSLQWSNYLYFITSKDRLKNDEVKKAKDLIEKDRNYARKFVISEEELNSVISPPKISVSVAAKGPNISTVWIDKLVKANLDNVILSDDYLPARLKLIEDQPARTELSTKEQTINSPATFLPFIRSLELREFRRFPNKRRFEFGTVNLIFGVNASGKTSLLEAIELLYCGRNKRNPSTTPPYTLAAEFFDGSTQIATDLRELQEFRDLNLRWYGQSEIKTNYLFQSFARFNFLDTDAAVSLAVDENSDQRLEEDLSRLLVGPEASKIWRDIERVSEAVDERLQDRLMAEVVAKNELVALETRLKEASLAKQASDSIYHYLEDRTTHLGWHISPEDKQEVADNLVGSLSEMISLIRQIMGLNPNNPLASSDMVEKYCHDSTIAIEKAGPELDRLESMYEDHKQLKESINRNREALAIANQAKRIIAANLPKRAAEQDDLQHVIDLHSDLLAGFDHEIFGVLSKAGSLTVTACRESAIAIRVEKENLASSAKDELNNFTKLREKWDILDGELRRIADEILQDSSNPDECPLCHTRFGPGELLKHIDADIADPFHSLSQRLLSQVEVHEQEYVQANVFEIVSEWLSTFCARANLGSDTMVDSALVEVQLAQNRLADAQKRLVALNSELLTLEAQGLSMAHAEEISAQLNELGYQFEEWSPGALDQLAIVISGALSTISRDVETVEKLIEESRQISAAALGLNDSDIAELQSTLSRKKDNLDMAESLRSGLRPFCLMFPWPGDRAFAEFLVEAQSIREIAAQLASTLDKETQAEISNTETIRSRETIEEKIADLRLKIDRLTDAKNVFAELKENHSLKNAMESVLQQNRTGIEIIFSRIHSPQEFQGLGSKLTTLFRKADGTEADLSRISTGQRTAFALSIFLAQNAQITEAPPVILIDDPLAHIDDLNALSFLDYLRELALLGKRQIFFTTADDKLASLFERKFDFLNTDFQRHDLSR